MSTFSTKGGLYERAQKKFKLSDGKALFTYGFFDRQRPEAQAFFADIYLEAVRARPARGHLALAGLQDAGRLLRHYTLNIDGLAEEVGMDTWHHERNAGGLPAPSPSPFKEGPPPVPPCPRWCNAAASPPPPPAPAPLQAG